MNLWIVSSAWAHRPGLSYARLDTDHVALTFAQPELAALVPLGEDLELSRVVVAQVTLDRATFTVAGEPCELGDVTLRRVEEDGVEIAAPLVCPPGEVTYGAGFLPTLVAGHRHYVEAMGKPVGVLDVGAPYIGYTGASDAGEVAAEFLVLGIEHIWTGYDHLLFLFGLLLAASTLRSMLFIVTGFTVAHSITLTAAALGLVSVPGSLIEPAIALSIAYVGVENFRKPPPRRRIAITFLLGLIHGFGFAGMLAELGLPRDALALALLCFNGGVELGQAAVVAVVLPLLLVLRRWSWWEAHAVPVASICVALAGVYWFVERVAG